ncbi:MAG TPA: ABC transporter permease [Gemmatimonadaceae bacterium]|nr:ABC transporter permease [Gemmatimonadaceae bacterium]
MNSDTPLSSRGGLTPGARERLSRSGMAALIVLLVIAAVCLLAPITAPYDPAAQPEIIELQSRAPSAEYPFGTDRYSRDVLSRVIYGGRMSLGVALVATLVSVTFGTAYGAVTGYATGVTRTILERILEALLSIPRLLLLIAIFAAWRNPPGGSFVVIVGLTGWYGLARLVRGQVLALKTRDFVSSARALGATQTRILVRHILPNVMTPVIVAATLGIGHVIVLEAGLSYLGIGIPEPAASWGTMIHDGSDNTRMADYWWMSVFPGLAIVITVMAFNVLGDALLRALRPWQTEAE